MLRKHIPLFHRIINLHAEPAPQHRNAIMEFGIRQIHAQARTTASTERQEVAFETWVLEPAFGTESEGLRKDCWVGVEQVGRLHNGLAAWDSVGVVGEVFVLGDTRQPDGDAVGAAEAFGYYGVLGLAVSEQRFTMIRDC